MHVIVFLQGLLKYIMFTKDGKGDLPLYSDYCSMNAILTFINTV